MSPSSETEGDQWSSQATIDGTPRAQVDRSSDSEEELTGVGKHGYRYKRFADSGPIVDQDGYKHFNWLFGHIGQPMVWPDTARKLEIAETQRLRRKKAREDLLGDLLERRLMMIREGEEQEREEREREELRRAKRERAIQQELLAARAVMAHAREREAEKRRDLERMLSRRSPDCPIARDPRIDDYYAGCAYESRINVRSRINGRSRTNILNVNLCRELDGTVW